MQFRHIIYAGLAVSVLWPLAASANTVDILGITNDGQNAQIKARLDLENKNLSGVKTYSYNMTDGFTVTNTTYSIFEDNGVKYVSAPVSYYPDKDGYTYRIELLFDDGSNYLSEVVNNDLTEAFMWLGDYQYAEGHSGWDDAHPPVVDREIDPSLQMTLDGTVYYKGVCNHAPGYLVYKFPESQFTKFVSRYGVQDTQSDGKMQFVFYKGYDLNVTSENNLTKIEEHTMYAKSNPKREEGSPIVRDINIDMSDVKVLRFQMNSLEVNWGDHGHLAMARLYLPVATQGKKQDQVVSFVNDGGDLTAPVSLSASSTSGGTMFYNIVSGRDLAVIEGNQLIPVWGGKGIVVVEATQFGDDNYYPATSYLSFNVDMQPRVSMLDLYTPSVAQQNKSAYAYLLVDTKGRSLDKLTVSTYNNPKNLDLISETDILGKYEPTKGAQVIEIPLTNYDDQVLQIKYSYAGDDADITLPYWHSEGSYDYISDFDRSKYTVVMGYGTFGGPNTTYNKMNGEVIEIGNGNTSLQKYKKGFNIHATGSLTVNANYLTPYDRVIVDMGFQKYDTHNLSNQKLTLQLYNGNTLLADTVDAYKPCMQQWDFPINNQSPLKFVGDQGSDGNGNDYVCIGAPRLYYSHGVKTPQTIQWDTDRRIINNQTSYVDLEAASESGFPIFYHIVSGSEYATIQDRRLVITTPPVGGADIVVDAYQPGNDVWAPAAVSTCRFGLVKGREVQRGEYLELSGSDTFDELIIHADKASAGQVTVKNGIVDVKKIILKYTFNPGEWVHIAFPSDLNIDNVSDLKSLGYSFNAFGAPAYYIKEYDSAGLALNTSESAWKMLASPSVKANKGYLMCVGSSSDDAPVEVTFTIDNSQVDLVNIMRALSLTVDFSGMQPNSKQNVTVTSANPDVISNNLTIEVSFQPSDLTTLPLNHQQALENMRYVFVGEHKALRLTLPDQTPAKVVFFDKSGKKVIKAVKYVAPNVIDLSGMKPGTYNMFVEYGNANRTFEIEL